MKPEDVKNRKDEMTYFLQFLNNANKPLDLGEFFLDSGYNKGIESFQNLMGEMELDGLIHISKTPSGHLPGLPHMQTNKVTYEITVKGVEYLIKNGIVNDTQATTEKNQKGKKGKKKFDYLNQILIGILITVVGRLILYLLINVF